MTATATSNAEETIAYLHESIDAGEHWYLALLRAMARWTAAEETIDGRYYRYLIGGEAFDWLLLAERLIDELPGVVGPEESEALLFQNHPPLEMDEEEFQNLIGTPKYQAYLNFLYGVIVEEALHLAVEEEIAKERQGHVYSAAHFDDATTYQRIYGRDQDDLLQEFAKERGLETTGSLPLSELREFTYWLFKYRVKTADGARVASDTRKGLVALSRIELETRRRLAPDLAD